MHLIWILVKVDRCPRILRKHPHAAWGICTVAAEWAPTVKHMEYMELTAEIRAGYRLGLDFQCLTLLGHNLQLHIAETISKQLL